MIYLSREEDCHDLPCVVVLLRLIRLLRPYDC